MKQLYKLGDVITVTEVDEHDQDRFIEIGQGGMITEIDKDGVGIQWQIVQGIAPLNDACDDYFLTYDQIKLSQ